MMNVISSCRSFHSVSWGAWLAKVYKLELGGFAITTVSYDQPLLIWVVRSWSFSNTWMSLTELNLRSILLLARMAQLWMRRSMYSMDRYLLVNTSLFV